MPQLKKRFLVHYAEFSVSNRAGILHLVEGFSSLNSFNFYFYQVVPGELTIVTGVPNSGKSEWIDALICNINHSVGWTFVLCSMENKVNFNICLNVLLFAVCTIYSKPLVHWFVETVHLSIAVIGVRRLCIQKNLVIFTNLVYHWIFLDEIYWY